MKRLLALCIFISCTSSVAFANDIDVYGTLAQGYIHTDQNNYFGDSTRGSFDFRELGIGASAQLSENLRVSGLLMSRKAGSTANGKISVDYLVADYAAYKDSSNTVGIKVGRQKIPFGFYNETRDIAETRPSVLLPQSIYFDNARQFLINADGAQIYGEHWSNGSYTKVSLNFMKTNGVNNVETETYFLGFDAPGYVTGHLAKGLKIEYSNGDTELSAWLADEPIEYVQGQYDFLGSGKVHVNSAVLSARHTFNQFVLTSEVFTAKTSYSGFGQYYPDFSVYPLGAYIQGEWIASDKWQFYTRYDASYTDSHDMNGSALAHKTGKPATAFFAKDSMVGARYRFTPTTSLSAELHSVHGTVWLPVSDNKNNSVSPDYNIFAMQLSHSF